MQKKTGSRNNVVPKDGMITEGLSFCTMPLSTEFSFSFAKLVFVSLSGQNEIVTTVDSTVREEITIIIKCINTSYAIAGIFIKEFT